MLTALAVLLQEAESVPFYADPFIRMPSIFTLVDITGTTIIGWMLWRLYQARIDKGGAVTTQEFRRLVGRLDAIEMAASERDKRDQSFRHDVIEANGAQLLEMRKQTSTSEKMLGKLTYVVTTLDSRPCVMNGAEKCPDGHETKGEGE